MLPQTLYNVQTSLDCDVVNTNFYYLFQKAKEIEQYIQIQKPYSYKNVDFHTIQEVRAEFKWGLTIHQGMQLLNPIYKFESTENARINGIQLTPGTIIFKIKNDDIDIGEDGNINSDAILVLPQSDAAFIPSYLTIPNSFVLKRTNGVWEWPLRTYMDTALDSITISSNQTRFDTSHLTMGRKGHLNNITNIVYHGALPFDRLQIYVFYNNEIIEGPIPIKIQQPNPYLPTNTYFELDKHYPAGSIIRFL